MAISPQFGSLIPSQTQQLLPSNYLQFNAGGAGANDFAQQFLPEIYEQEVERYGNRTLSGFLRASNQMIHAYYTPRVTLFKQKSAKLYVEGIAGMKGNALTYRLFDGDADDNGELVEQDVLELRMTWNAGLAIGTRMDINENFALDLRYARVYSGALNKIDSYSIEDDVVYTSDWKAPVGYFRIGLNYVY